MTDGNLRHHHLPAPDGTSLHVAEAGPVDGAALPLLCLPGLTRKWLDFEPVFARWATHRRVVAMDFRGRGLSAQADPATYRPDVEAQDTLHLLRTLNIPRVALLGTSRGGIVGMVMANMAPEVLAGLCLNDIGARLEPEGLLRIMGYVGKPVSHPTWQAAADAVKQASSGFTGMENHQWLAMAQRMYREVDGRIVHTHDLALAQSLPSKDDVQQGKLPELWHLLPALANMPVSLLRGSGSDLLSAETVSRMEGALPQLDATSVPGRGHVPLLDEPESTAAITRWLSRVDAAA